MSQDEKLIREQICDVCHKMWQLGWSSLLTMGMYLFD